MYTFFSNFWNLINTNTFLSVVMTCIVVFLGIKLTIYIIRLLSNIRAYIINRSNTFYLSNQKNMPGNVSLPMPERVELTNSILDTIDQIIANEILSEFKTYISLNTLYNISNLDTDASKISQTVFNSIKKEIYTEANLILTENYLMEYITKKTINTLIETSQIHNNNIRTVNQSSGD